MSISCFLIHCGKNKFKKNTANLIVIYLVSYLKHSNSEEDFKLHPLCTITPCHIYNVTYNERTFSWYIFNLSLWYQCPFPLWTFKTTLDQINENLFSFFFLNLFFMKSGFFSIIRTTTKKTTLWCHLDYTYIKTTFWF